MVSGAVAAVGAVDDAIAPVTVASCTMLVHGHGGSRVAVLDWVSQSPASLPARLEPGTTGRGWHAASMKASLDHNLGARQRWLIRPIVGDPTGRAYKAKLGCRGWQRLRLRQRHWLVLT